jgi:hypothetical protein
VPDRLILALDPGGPDAAEGVEPDDSVDFSWLRSELGVD